MAQNPATPSGVSGRLGPAGDHDVGVAAGDDPERVADRVGAGGAGRDVGAVRALGPEADGDLARGLVDDRLDEEERRDPVRALLQQDLVVLLDRADAADAGADVDAGPVALEVARSMPGIAHGQVRGRQGEPDEGVHLADLLAVDEGQGIEVLDLAADAGGVAGQVEPGQGPDAALAAREGPARSCPSPCRGAKRGRCR